MTKKGEQPKTNRTAKGRMNGNLTGNGFDKNPQNINRTGKNRKLLGGVNKELKAEGYEPATQSQIKEAFELLLNLPEAKIKHYINDADSPMLLRIVARSMLSAKGPDIIERILDRAHGKPKQAIDHTSGGESLVHPALKDLSDDELRTIEKVALLSSNKDGEGQ